MHESGLGPALPDRHLERLDDELGTHVLGIAQPTQRRE
jgi:hypothetical protein